MSKIPPEMPDFLKKNEEQSNEMTPPPIPEHLKKPEPVAASEQKEDKKKSKFSFGKSKNPLIEFRNDKGEMVLSAPTPATAEKTFSDYFTPMIGQILAALLLVSIGAGLFFYYQAEAYKNRFQAMDTRILSFTKEIASLNQENNSLSGKIVNYQKELEGKSDTKIQELQKQVVELQAQLGTKPNPNVSVGTQTSPVNGTTTLKPVEAADPVPASQAVSAPNAMAAPTAVPGPTKLTPGVNTQSPNRPAPTGPKTVEKATDPSVNYEVRLKTAGESACLQYYKTENLKKCQGRDAKYTAVTIGSKNTPTGIKLTYQCVGSGIKPLNFKYGPMEIYNNCVGR